MNQSINQFFSFPDVLVSDNEMNPLLFTYFLSFDDLRGTKRKMFVVWVGYIDTRYDISGLWVLLVVVVDD